MEIKNNRLVGVEYKASPNTSGTIKPLYLIMHFTASSTASGAISWLTDPKSKVSAHLHIDREGNIVQMVDFNKRAYHAGKSEWKGQSDLNWHTIGIELQNTGTQEYTEKQIQSLVEANRAIVREYGIKEIVGHSDISPGRKTDPGKQFPWDRVRRESFGETTSVKSITKTTTSDLNLREGAGTNFSVVEVLKKGSEVIVVSEENNWSQVVYCANKSKGWVSSAYLK